MHELRERDPPVAVTAHPANRCHEAIARSCLRFDYVNCQSCMNVSHIQWLHSLTCRLLRTRAIDLHARRTFARERTLARRTSHAALFATLLVILDR